MPTTDEHTITSALDRIRMLNERPAADPLITFVEEAVCALEWQVADWRRRAQEAEARTQELELAYREVRNRLEAFRQEMHA